MWCLKGEWVDLSSNFTGKGVRPPTTLGVRKIDSLGHFNNIFLHCMGDNIYS